MNKEQTAWRTKQCRRVRIAEALRRGRSNLAHIDAADLRRTADVIEVMATIRKEVGETMPTLRRLHFGYWRRFAALVGDFEQRTIRNEREDDRSIAIPRASRCYGQTAENLDGSTLKIDSLNQAVREKRHRAAIGRPERI